MALVTSSRRRQAPTSDVQAVAMTLAKAVIPELVDSLRGMSLTRPTRKARQPGRKERAGKKQAQNKLSKPSQNVSNIGKTIVLGNSDKMRVRQSDISVVANSSTAGVTNFGWALGMASTQTGTLNWIGAIVPRLGTLAGLYREFLINTIQFRWVPNQGYTTAGSVAMGIDPSPLAGIPTGLGSVIHHTSSGLFDIKAEKTITWNPRTDVKLAPRYTTASGFDEDELSFGVFQFYSSNGLAASTAIGVLQVTVDITFIGAM